MPTREENTTPISPKSRPKRFRKPHGWQIALEVAGMVAIASSVAGGITYGVMHGQTVQTEQQTRQLNHQNQSLVVGNNTLATQAQQDQTLISQDTQKLTATEKLVAQTQGQLATVQHNLTQTQGQVATLTQTQTQNTAEIQALHQKDAGLNTQITQTTTQINQTDAQIQQTDQAMVPLSQEVTKLTEQLHQANAQIATQKAQIATVSAQLTQSATKITTLQNTQATLKNTQTTLNTQIAGLKQTIASLQDQLKATISVTQAQQIKHQIAQDTATLNSLTARATQLQTAIAQTGAEITTLTKTRTTLQTELTTAQTQLQTAQAQATRLQDALNAKTTAVAQAEKQLAGLEQTLNQVAGTLKNDQTTINNDQTEITHLTHENQTLNGEITQDETTVASLTTQAKHLTTQAAQLKTQIATLTNTIPTLKQQINLDQQGATNLSLEDLAFSELGNYVIDNTDSDGGVGGKLQLDPWGQLIPSTWTTFPAGTPDNGGSYSSNFMGVNFENIFDSLYMSYYSQYWLFPGNSVDGVFNSTPLFPNNNYNALWTFANWLHNNLQNSIFAPKGARGNVNKMFPFTYLNNMDGLNPLFQTNTYQPTGKTLMSVQEAQPFIATTKVPFFQSEFVNIGYIIRQSKAIYTVAGNEYDEEWTKASWLFNNYFFPGIFNPYGCGNADNYWGTMAMPWNLHGTPTGVYFAQATPGNTLQIQGADGFFKAYSVKPLGLLQNKMGGDGQNWYNSWLAEYNNPFYYGSRFLNANTTVPNGVVFGNLDLAQGNITNSLVETQIGYPTVNGDPLMELWTEFLNFFLSFSYWGAINFNGGITAFTNLLNEIFPQSGTNATQNALIVQAIQNFYTANADNLTHQNFFGNVGAFQNLYQGDRSLTINPQALTPGLLSMNLSVNQSGETGLLLTPIIGATFPGNTSLVPKGSGVFFVPQGTAGILNGQHLTSQAPASVQSNLADSVAINAGFNSQGLSSYYAITENGNPVCALNNVQDAFGQLNTWAKNIHPSSVW